MAEKLYVVLSQSKKRRIYERQNGSWYYLHGGKETDLEYDQEVEDNSGNNRRCHTCSSEKKKRTCHNCYLKRMYGITERKYRQMWREQGGRCCICSTQFEDESHGVVDHNHSTKHVRGLLCEECNLGLGNFKDNPYYMRRAANYVEQRK